MNRRQSLGAILAAAACGLLPKLAGAEEKRPRILVTGFGEWGTHTHNPTRYVIKALADEGVEAYVLPVTFAGSVEEFDRLYDRIKPDIVLCLGLSAGATGFRIETQAHNALNQKLTDAADSHSAPVIDPDGPDTRTVTLPIHNMAQALQQKNLPVDFSKNAGGFVCENILYHALSRAGETKSPPMTGFVHISYPSPEKISKEQQVNGIKLILAECEREFRCGPSVNRPEPRI